MKYDQDSLSVLLIAPFPPPLTGHSIADKLLLDSLKDRHKVSVVDLSIGSKHDGTVSVRRIRAVINVLIKVVALRKRVDVAYLTISEMFFQGVHFVHGGYNVAIIYFAVLLIATKLRAGRLKIFSRKGCNQIKAKE